ncbi:MAG TPA: DUF2254 domain-containing protein [Dehalococcoidia bacterium]
MAGTVRGTVDGAGERLRVSLWFLPGLMTLGAAALAAVLVRSAGRLDGQLRDVSPWLFSGDAESAAELLGTIAGSVITVAGVVFSVTMVALTLVAQQQTPRVLRTFVADRVTQLVLGGFIGVFTYALVVLRSVRGTDGAVPATAVTVGVLLALGAVALLILFIHHMAQSVQVANVAARITRETVAQVPRLFPEPAGEPAPSPAAVLEPAGSPAPVHARAFGYVQAVDAGRILKVARAEDVLIRLERGLGDFVAPGARLAAVWPAERASDALAGAVRAAVVTGTSPSLRHDVGFGIRQLADIAVRALSPGVNDPTTATTCIDHLGVVLAQVINRAPPAPLRRDAEGRPRVILPAPDFPDLAALAFDQIRTYGKHDAAVLRRMLQTLLYLAALTESPARRAALARLGEQVARAAEQGIDDEEDRSRVMRLARQVMALRPPEGGPPAGGVAAGAGGPGRRSAEG